MTKKQVVFNGPFFAPDGVEFDPTRDYTYCRICGTIYQPAITREQEQTPANVLTALFLRKEWSQRHARSHSDRQHRLLAMSGRHCTPEALQQLVPMGVIPISDIVFDQESEYAGLESPRAPRNDAEGSRY